MTYKNMYDNILFMFEENVKVKYSEMDYKLALKPSALLNFLQDFASENAESLGFGYSYITKKNLAWFLLKYRMEFNEYPVGEYNLKLKTEPRGYNKLFAYRDFEIHNKEKCLARIASTWSLLNTENGKLSQIGQALDENINMPPLQKRENDLVYAKIKHPEKIDIEKIFEIRYDDIDVNKHVNNCNYIIWAFEPLGFEFKSTRRLKVLDMVFKKEIKYGSKVKSQIEIVDENFTLHTLKNAETDEDLCLINAKWN